MAEEIVGTPLPMPEPPIEELGMVEPGVQGEDGTVINEEPEEDTPDDEVIEEEPDEEIIPEAPVATLTDPGEYKPNDYSFEVTIFDDEGKRGKTVKIKTVEQFDELMDQDVNFGTAASVAKAIRMASKMEASLDKDEEKYQAAKEAFESEKQILETRTQALNTMQSEMDYLVGRGDLPKITKELKGADWSDPEVSKQPAVKAQLDLINYMSKENKSREKAGLKPISSLLDGFNAYQLDQNRKQTLDNKNKQTDARKSAASRVGTSSPNPMTVAPKGIAVGRVGVLDI